MTLYSLGAVTVARYRVYTGDNTTPGTYVSGSLVEAEMMLAEELRRGLASEERTESLRIRNDGRVYPTAYPITVATGLRVDGRSIMGAPLDVDTFVGLIDVSPPPRATVTYTGGYTGHAGAKPLPVALEHAVYDIARRLAEDQAPVLVGATAASVGDVSVTYASPSGSLDALAPGLSTRVGRYRNRFV